MTMQAMRVGTVCAFLLTLLGCSTAGHYPISGEAASPTDPVMYMTMPIKLMPN